MVKVQRPPAQAHGQLAVFPISLSPKLWECFPVSIPSLNPVGLAAYSKESCSQGGAPGMRSERRGKACKALQHLQNAERNLLLHSRKMYGWAPISRHLKYICLCKKNEKEQSPHSWEWKLGILVLISFLKALWNRSFKCTLYNLALMGVGWH